MTERLKVEVRLRRCGIGWGWRVAHTWEGTPNGRVPRGGTESMYERYALTRRGAIRAARRAETRSNRPRVDEVVVLSEGQS